MKLSQEPIYSTSIIHLGLFVLKRSRLSATRSSTKNKQKVHKEIDCGIGKAAVAFIHLNKLWSSKTELQFYNSNVLWTLLFFVRLRTLNTNNLAKRNKTELLQPLSRILNDGMTSSTTRKLDINLTPGILYHLQERPKRHDH